MIISHSQSGAFSCQAAINNPGQVKAVVALEPSGGADTDDTQLATMVAAGTKHLMVWGDNFEGHERWAIFRGIVEDYRRRVTQAGGYWQDMDLPALGIQGNSHYPMMDRNSDQVARMIQDWLSAEIT